MQRVLSRGEIEKLDRIEVPEIYLPEGAQVFEQRAHRLGQLAAENPLQDYLQFIAQLVQIQQQLHNEFPLAQLLESDLVAQAQAQGVAPLSPLIWQRHEVWLEILRQLVQRLQTQVSAKAAPQQELSSLHKALANASDMVNDSANALLVHDVAAVSNLAWAPFIMAALQVYATQLAAHLDADALANQSAFGTCPCCGGLPVASLVHARGKRAGRRYAVCGLCSTQWHIVRVTCTHCESTADIAYYLIEQGGEAIRAESCGQCNSYRKIFYQEKDADLEAVADDMGSIELDMLMGQEGFYRVNNNPLLWLPND